MKHVMISLDTNTISSFTVQQAVFKNALRRNVFFSFRKKVKAVLWQKFKEKK